MIAAKLIIISVLCIITLYVLIHLHKKQSRIPKIIWTYWDQKEVPHVVEKCINTWKKHNPDWKIVVLNNDTLHRYLPGVNFAAFKNIDRHERMSDIVRCLVLAKYGGVWSDASIIVNRSFDELLSKQCAGGYEFMGYYLDSFTSDCRYPVIENWFFACVQGSAFMEAWKDTFLAITRYDSIESYVADLQKSTNVQRIDDPIYLAMHVAAQYVLQNKMHVSDIKRKLYVEKAEDGPFVYLTQANWDQSGLMNICTKPHKVPLFYKLRGVERNTVMNDYQRYKCIFD